MVRLELYGSAGCPYTEELREKLRWERRAFTEYNVEVNAEARARMLALTDGKRTVPVLVEEGEVVQIGWQGRGCST